MSTPQRRPRLYRSRRHRVIGGVCGGIADRFGWRPSTVRLLFVVSVVLPGPQFLVYIVLWLVIPPEPLPGQQVIDV